MRPWNRFTSVMLAVLITGSASVVTAGTVSGGAVWEWQNPRPVGNTLTNVVFTTATQGWIVGAEGTVLYTGDGGATWASRGPKTVMWLNGVSFADELYGWVVGYGGAIYHTADAGASWTAQDAGSDTYLKGVEFVSRTSGWAVGHSGTILHTSDGGATWSPQANPGGTLNAADFWDADNGWVAGDSGTLLHTANGGGTWTAQDPGTTGDLSDVSFWSPNAGCAAGPPGIFCTTDGGVTWHQRYTPQGWSAMDYMQGIHVLPGGVGWAVGEAGYVLYTVNGGLTWDVQVYSSASLFAVAAISGSSAVAVGDVGTIRSTADGGSTWVNFYDLDHRNFNAVDFVSDTEGWAVGYAGRMMHTTTGGDSWTESYPYSIAGHLHGVDFASAANGWAVGDGGVIVSTTTGGVSWALSTYSATEFQDLEDVDFVEGTTVGWAVGTGGTIIKTVTGTGWTIQSLAEAYYLYGVSAVDVQHAWVAGGGIWYTADGGQSWIPQTLPPGSSAHAVHFIDLNRGWAVGEAGSIVHTTDGGQTWVKQQSVNPGYAYPDLYAVWFADENNGWAAGVPFGSLMLRTTDGGATWEMQSHGCSQTIEGLFFTDATHGWAVGRGGTILRYLAPDDAIPPVTTTNAPTGWSNASVMVTLTASDAGTGPAWTYYRVDGGAWQTGNRATVIANPAWPFTTEGKHRVRYYSIDHAGNREATKIAMVYIDTRRPWTEALVPVTVYRGATAGLRYRVNDELPNGGTADVTIRIKTLAGNTVMTFTLPGKPVNTALRKRFVCNLPVGTYRYIVFAVDAAGNRQYYKKNNYLFVK